MQGIEMFGACGPEFFLLVAAMKVFASMHPGKKRIAVWPQEGWKGEPARHPELHGSYRCLQSYRLRFCNPLKRRGRIISALCNNVHWQA